MAAEPVRGTRAAPAAGILLLAIVNVTCTIPRWPAHGPLTSAYGLRFDGLIPEVHDGVDISVPDGTPVLAMRPGRVIFAGSMTGYGITVMLRHGEHLVSVYGHLSRTAVRTGQDVDDHDVIGYSGHTGNATGPHLHFEIRRWGHPADPVPLLGGPPGP